MRHRLSLLALAALACCLLPASRDLPARAGTAPTIGTLVVTGVASGNSSVKVAYQAYPGAGDYRIYDQANPTRVKYAGTVYNGSAMVPSTTVEWNTLYDDQPHTLIVQAVDQLGPVPRANQYDGNNAPLVTPSGMLGANSGPTADGLTSINGQGPYTDTVTVLAQSQPFVVQANPSYQAIPSSPDATGAFFDTFGASDGQPIRTGVGAAAMTETWTLGSGTSHAWDIRGFGIDTDLATTMPFLSDGHLMDMVFDGGGPGNSNPLHTQYGSISYIPRQTVDISNGQLVHLTAEVDQHVDTRRWWQFYVLPHDDPFNGNNAGALPPQRVNAGNIGLQVVIAPGGCTAAEFTGPPSGTATHTSLAQSGIGGSNWCRDFNGAYGQGNGQGLDNRSREDLFLTQSRYALFEDGHLVNTAPISPTLPIGVADAYFSHYLYHSALEQQELRTSRPYETYWINQLPYSDERHWQALGVETLPSADVPSGSWSVLASRVQIPPFVAPQFVAATATPTSTATPTDTATDTPVPSDTPTATATDTPLPTDTATATPADTSTATSTQTPLPSDTATATATACDTATSTATDTATQTPTDTATDSPTATSTPTPSSWTVETLIRNPQGTVVSDVTSPFAG